MAMLSKHDRDRSRVAGSTHEISGLCSFWLEWLVIKLMRTLIQDRAGQLGESGEYWMGMLRVV
jgi:hypothetical protein